MRVLTVVLLVALGMAALPAGAALAAVPRCKGVPATQFLTSPGILTGTSGDDVLVGSNGDDTINGLGGNDLICGRDGGDSILPGSGDDTVDGGDGNDQIFFGLDGEDEGNDTLNGGRGDDTILDNAGANVAHGGRGSDSIGVSGKAYGDSGDDRVVGAFETSPGAHDAYASGGSGSDGSAFEDVVVHGGVADGGSGNDHILLEAPGDQAIGGSGSDDIDADYPGGTGQTLNCGSGFDTYTTADNDTVLPNCEQDVTP